MTTALVFALCLLDAGGADELVLDASRVLNGETLMEFRSAERAVGGRPARHRIADSVIHHTPRSALQFELAGGVKGVVPAAKGSPRTVTLARTTYRPLVQDEVQFTGRLPEQKAEYEQPLCLWVEAKQAAPAFVGGRLEAELFNGEQKGAPMVRCASEVTGDGTNGYSFVYTVENRTGRTLRFKWAGLEGEVKPGKTYTHSEAAKELTAEESGLLTIQMADGPEFAIRANLWARPK